jgi:hypothetical protein
MPTTRATVGRSAPPVRSAMSVTNSGTVAIRIAARDEETRCSPNPISGHGIASSTTVNASSGSLGSPRRAPARAAIGSSTAAATTSRDHAMNSGESSSSATLMNR